MFKEQVVDSGSYLWGTPSLSFRKPRSSRCCPLTTYFSPFLFSLGEKKCGENCQLPSHKNRVLSSPLWAKEGTWDKEKNLPLTFTFFFRSEEIDLIFPLPKSIFIPLASCYYSLTRSFNCFIQVAGGDHNCSLKDPLCFQQLSLSPPQSSTICQSGAYGGPGTGFRRSFNLVSSLRVMPLCKMLM